MAKDDKTEAPTPKRKREARKKGQIPKSAEIVTWVQVLAASFLLELTLGRAGDALRRVMTEVSAGIAQPDQGTALALLGEGLWQATLAVLPLAGAMAAIGVVGNVAQTGGFASLSMLAPKPERLNPIAGFKRLVSPHGLWQAGRSALKIGALVLVAWPPLDDLTRSLVARGQLPVGTVAVEVAETALQIARNTAILGLVIAALDYALQRRKVMNDMKMTKQAVKDEHRQSEGDPQLKGQIRQRQLAIGRNRMIASVADANVVIVNPTHVAVALQYVPGRGAPRVVAKGKGAVAARIREEAERHFVPLVRDIALARTLESTVQLGQEVPAELYEAVARVLAFLAQVGRRNTFGGVLQLATPVGALGS